MSQIFTCLKDQALDHSDELTTRMLDECIELWAAMMKSSARRGHLNAVLNEIERKARRGIERRDEIAIIMFMLYWVQGPPSTTSSSVCVCFCVSVSVT